MTILVVRRNGKERKRKEKEDRVALKQWIAEGGLVEFRDKIKEKWPNMKFDIVVGNPPYGMGTSEIHLQIFKTILDFCNNKLCFIMPSKPVVQQLKSKWYGVFKNAVCTNVDIVDKSTFKETNMDNTAIYYCDRNANPEDYCKMLDVDDNIPYLFDDEGHRLFIEKMGLKCKEKHLKYKFLVDGHYADCFKKILNGVQTDKWYLNVNSAGTKPGKGEIVWISGDVLKQGIKDSNEEVKYCEDNHKVKAIIECPTIEYGKNLKSLMVDGKVLRYGLWLRQISQNLNDDVYTYVPDLGYTNIHNDEELLADCGFDEDEIKKVLDYLSTFDFSQNRNAIVRGEDGKTEETKKKKSKSTSVETSPDTNDDLKDEWDDIK